MKFRIGLLGSCATTNSDLRTLFLAPCMIHETFRTPTETAFGSHPRCVVSISYAKPKSFHGGNTGSNPVGDANLINHSQIPSRILYVR